MSERCERNICKRLRRLLSRYSYEFGRSQRPPNPVSKVLHCDRGGDLAVGFVADELEVFVLRC